MLYQNHAANLSYLQNVYDVMLTAFTLHSSGVVILPSQYAHYYTVYTVYLRDENATNNALSLNFLLSAKLNTRRRRS